MRRLRSYRCLAGPSPPAARSCSSTLSRSDSLCYDYKHNKDCASAESFKVAVLKLFAAKRPFDTTQVKKDLKHFPAGAWNRDNKDVTQ